MRAHAFVCALSAISCGCVPFGDCWPEVTANVSVDRRVAVPNGATLLVVYVTKSADGDVSGTNEQGIPVGNRRGQAEPIARIAADTAAFSRTFRANSGQTWYYAFADLNGNRTLDPGEPFGVDTRNPHDADCSPRRITITLDRIYACSRYGYWTCWPSTDVN